MHAWLRIVRCERPALVAALRSIKLRQLHACAGQCVRCEIKKQLVCLVGFASRRKGARLSGACRTRCCSTSKPWARVWGKLLGGVLFEGRSRMPGFGPRGCSDLSEPWWDPRLLCSVRRSDDFWCPGDPAPDVRNRAFRGRGRPRNSGRPPSSDFGLNSPPFVALHRIPLAPSTCPAGGRSAERRRTPPPRLREGKSPPAPPHRTPSSTGAGDLSMPCGASARRLRRRLAAWCSPPPSVGGPRPSLGAAPTSP